MSYTIQDKNNPHRYDDIIELPAPKSKTRPHMSLYDRAAQFASFKALSGYEEMVAETAAAFAGEQEENP